MNKKYEILAPAGNLPALQAAVQSGADAVYLAGKDFGARKFAGNFSSEQLADAVAYCHIRGVNVYVTVNTLVFNHELDRLKEYIDFLYTTGIDAVIVQDIGVLDYIRRMYPDLDIHCSTQMSVQTVADIRYLESLGVKRVVLGREMSIEDIHRSKQATGVQLETFVHGALCISVSGQCLMSSMIGGRSGNRGCCAQPCRQKYSLVNLDVNEVYRSPHGDYLLSPKDLYTLDHIRSVIDAGAFSLKIEGRMKSPEYVATVVRAYKTVLENPHADRKTLERELKIFNRGFTKGHIFGDRGSALMSMNSPGNQGYYLGKVVSYDKKARKVTLSLAAGLHHNDEIQIRRRDESVGGRVEKLMHNGSVVKRCLMGQICSVNFKHDCKAGEEVYKTYDEEVMKTARLSYSKEFLEIPVNIKAFIKKGTAVLCRLSDGLHTVESTGEIPDEAVNRSITADEVEAQLSKLGGTPYKAQRIDIHLDEGLSVPAKELNRIRRELIEKLNQKRIAKYVRQSKVIDKSEIKKPKKSTGRIELTYAVSTVLQLEKLMDLGTAVIYYKDLDTLEAAIEAAKEKNYPGKIIPEISRLMSDDDLENIEERLRRLQIDTVLVQSYGHSHIFGGFRKIADFHLNIVNDYAYRVYEKQGFERLTLSPELNLQQLSSMDVEQEKTEYLGYGYIPVMAMKHCVVSTALNKQINCGLCGQGSYCLIDKKNERFKIMRRYRCHTEIYNSKKLFLLEYSKKLEQAGIGYFRLNFLDETPDEVEMVVDLHKKFISSQLTADDHEIMTLLKESGITSGHLNRGVE